MECRHYSGDCKIITKCCPDKIYGCWRCHDEECEDHKIFTKREDIHILICKKCGYKNKEKTNECNQCHHSFGKKYCLVCCIFENEDHIEFYHCDECGICRSGKREERRHCTTCNLCVSTHKNHKCCKKSLSKCEDCSICRENLYSSTEKIYVNPCGHYYHNRCLEKYIENCGERAIVPTCPLCKKSIYEPEKIESIFDRFSSSILLSEECKKRCQSIKCIDCEKVGDVQYHPIYRKCLECHSYNTMLWNKK